MNIHESVLSTIKKKFLSEDFKKDPTKIIPTHEFMEKWFDEFNKKYFNNELPHIKLETGDCGHNIWGCFKGTRMYNSRTRKWMNPFDPDKCSIMLNNLYAGTEYSLKNTMIHEMVHYWIYYHYSYHPTRSHGIEFLTCANKINNISEWDITPNSDNIEGELSNEGLKRYKKRISNEYIICVFEYYSHSDFNLYHAIRTEENYIDAVIKTLKRWKSPMQKWYKLKTDNPRFGVEEHINRGGQTLTYIESANQIEDVFKKINNIYGEIEYEEFVPEIKDPEISYLCILYKDGSYYACKLTDTKWFDKIKKNYSNQYLISFYKINDYNEAFDIAYPSKSRVKVICQSYDENEFLKKLNDKFGINLKDATQIK